MTYDEMDTTLTQINDLRRREVTALRIGDHNKANDLAVAADLLEIHAQTGLSLDHWDSARTFVERHTGASVVPNGV